MHRESTDFIEVLVGTNDLTTGGQYYKVQNFVMHENYNEKWHQNDIAVVKIDDQFEFNDKVQPIAYTSDEIPDESDVQLTG